MRSPLETVATVVMVVTVASEVSVDLVVLVEHPTKVLPSALEMAVTVVMVDLAAMVAAAAAVPVAIVLQCTSKDLPRILCGSAPTMI